MRRIIEESEEEQRILRLIHDEAHLGKGCMHVYYLMNFKMSQGVYRFLSVITPQVLLARDVPGCGGLREKCQISNRSSRKQLDCCTQQYVEAKVIESQNGKLDAILFSYRGDKPLHIFSLFFNVCSTSCLPTNVEYEAASPDLIELTEEAIEQALEIYLVQK